APYRAELEAQGVPTLVVDYSKHSWQELATELGRHTGLERQAQAGVPAQLGSQFLPAVFRVVDHQRRYALRLQLRTVW
ncbi:hypothetical protein ACV33D_29450, partial [Pseudomonas aeruginosa]